jgi:1,4-dihydroxy-2-naphthoyl-CoA hydrolase
MNGDSPRSWDRCRAVWPGGRAGLWRPRSSRSGSIGAARPDGGCTGALVGPTDGTGAPAAAPRVTLARMAQEPGRAGIDSFSELIGVEDLDAPEGEARGRVAVGDHLRQPYGVVHGGVYASLAETITSRATWLAVRDEGLVAMGQANQTTFLRPISAGHVTAHAVARHRGTTTWVWDVEITDDGERVCALVRMTISVRPARAG